MLRDIGVSEGYPSTTPVSLFLLCFGITKWPCAAFSGTACYVQARGPERPTCAKNFMRNAFDLYLRCADKRMKFIFSLKG